MRDPDVIDEKDGEHLLRSTVTPSNANSKVKNQPYSLNSLATVDLSTRRYPSAATKRPTPNSLYECVNEFVAECKEFDCLIVKCDGGREGDASDNAFLPETVELLKELGYGSARGWTPSRPLGIGLV